jgi:hypothetical protein
MISRIAICLWHTLANNRLRIKQAVQRGPLTSEQQPTVGRGEGISVEGGQKTMDGRGV